jgi:hypothetical protein
METIKQIDNESKAIMESHTKAKLEEGDPITILGSDLPNSREIII